MIYLKSDMNEKDIKKNFSTKYLFKYLKYKKKYLQLKNQLGGVPFCQKFYNNRSGTCWAVAMQTLLTFGQATSDALGEKITAINQDKQLLTTQLHKMYGNDSYIRIFPPNFFTPKNYSLIIDLLDRFIDRYNSKIHDIRVVEDTHNTGFCEYAIAENFNKIVPNLQSFFSLKEYGGNNTFDYIFGNLLSVSLLDHRISLINYYDSFHEIKFDPNNDLGILINLRDHVCCLYICDGTEKYYDNYNQVYDCNWSVILSNPGELYVDLSSNFRIIDYQAFPNKEKLKKIESLTLIKKNVVSNLNMEILNLLNGNYFAVKDRTLQFEIAFHFYEGAGNDKSKGIEYFKKSASQGYARAQFILGYILWQGENIAENKDEGRRLLDLAANQGNAEALSFMSQIYAEEKNYQEANKYFLRAAECGHVLTQYAVGLYHLEQSNRDEAIRWFNAAANKDHYEAQFNLGLLLMQGNSDEQSLGIKWLKTAAQSGNQDAIEWLKTAAKTGNQDAIEWLKTAAKTGNRDAIEWLKANPQP